MPADADGGLNEIHGYPQGQRDVRGEHTGRADRAGLPVGLLEIGPSQRHEHVHMAGVRLGQASASGRGPLDYLVRQCLCGVRVTARRRVPPSGG